jgi:hypothetical protein
MGFLSHLEDFLFEGFEFHRKKRRAEWDEKYKECPTGKEMAEKYNQTAESIQLNPGSWLAYIGDNK